MIQGIVFDLGSTLIRFDGDWRGAIARGQTIMAEALQQEGVEIDTRSFVAALASSWEVSAKAREADNIERPTFDVFKEVLAEFVPTEVEEQVLRSCLEKMYASSEVYWKPMPGLHSVLGDLHGDGYKLGLISNAGDDQNVQRLIDKVGIRHYFKPILVSAAVGIRKPHPAIFDILLQSWRLPADRVVMVGDTLTADILGAQKVGMRTIWLKADSDGAVSLEQPMEIVSDEVAQTLVEVPGIVRQMAADPGDEPEELA